MTESAQRHNRSETRRAYEIRLGVGRLAVCLALAVALLGCEAMRDWLEATFTNTPAPQAASTISQTSEQPPQPDGWSLPEGSDDAVIGWSDSGRFFAYRERRVNADGEPELLLHLLDAVTGRRVKDGQGLLRQKLSKEVRSAQTFNRKAAKHLKKFDFSDRPDPIEALVDEGSFDEKDGQKTLDGSRDWPIHLSDGKEGTLFLSVATRETKNDPEHPAATSRESLLTLSLVCDQGPDSPPKRQNLYAGSQYEPGVGGYRLRAVYPNAKARRLAILIERYDDGNQPLRTDLFGLIGRIGSLDPSKIKAIIKERSKQGLFKKAVVPTMNAPEPNAPPAQADKATPTQATPADSGKSR